MAAKRGGGSEGAARQSSEEEYNELEAPGSKQLIPHQFKTFGQHFIVTTWPKFWWWCTVLLSVPFSAYAMIYVLALEPAIRGMSIAKGDGLPDVGAYAQGILDHMKLWQAHSVCAIVYIITAPLQFVDRVRLKRIPFHRASGYAFLASGVVLAGTGLFMAPHSEFGNGFVLGTAFLAPAWLFSAGNAVWNIRNRRVQRHREWMIRTAAIGFSVIFLRPVTGLLALLTGITLKEAGIMALWICFLLALAGTQLYIEMRYHGYGGIVPVGKLKAVT